jgi:alpha-D-ribose 1-methylphosphonate 5-triphosphate synthase subunit PhnI
VTVTDCEVTQCEAVVPAYAGRDDPQFALGYGLTFGRNERKAIAASILDASIRLDGTAEPAEDPEFVLDVIDGMDSFGFIEHLKLPHYVTFQSILDRIRSIRDREGSEGRGGDAGAAEDLEDRGGNAGAAGGGQRSEGRGGEERAAEGDEGRDGDERTEAAGDVGGGADAGMGADADAETDEVDATPEVDDD